MKKYIILLFLLLQVGTKTQAIVNPADTALLTAISSSMGTLVSATNMANSKLVQMVPGMIKIKESLEGAMKLTQKVYDYYKKGEIVALFIKRHIQVSEKFYKISRNIIENSNNLTIQEVELFVALLDYAVFSVGKDLDQIWEDVFFYLDTFVKGNNNSSDNLNNISDALAFFNFLENMTLRLEKMDRELFLIDKYSKAYINKKRFENGMYDLELYKEYVYKETLLTYKNLRNNSLYND